MITPLRSVSDITKHNIDRSVFITHGFLLFWLTKIILCKGYSKLGLKNYSKQCLTYELNQNATALSKTQLLKYGTQSISLITLSSLRVTPSLCMCYHGNQINNLFYTLLRFILFLYMHRLQNRTGSLLNPYCLHCVSVTLRIVLY